MTLKLEKKPDYAQPSLIKNCKSTLLYLLEINLLVSKTDEKLSQKCGTTHTTHTLLKSQVHLICLHVVMTTSSKQV